jgi:excisionase family DNA binding protein
MAVTTKTSRSALITTKQLAGFLRVSVSTVYAWRQRGTGPPGYRVGRHTRYRVDEVLAWLERQKASPPETRELDLPVSNDDGADSKEVNPRAGATT